MAKKDDATTLEDALKELEDKYGQGCIMTEDSAPKNIEFTTTGSFVLDDILGGGIPAGRIIECFGEASSGKSTLALFIASQFQKQGKKVAFLDHENAYSREYAEKLGVNTKDLLVSQPDTLEEAYDIIVALASTKKISLIIVDSVSAMVPKAEFESDDPLKDTMALQARVLSRALRQLTGPLSKTGTSVIFINQTRASFVMYGPSDTTSGGKALKFYSSIRLQVKKEKLEERFKGPKDSILGNALRISAVKNKCAPPFRTGCVDLYFGSGIDLSADLFDTAIRLEVIKKESNTYTYDNKKIGVGTNQSKQFLNENKEISQKIGEEIHERIKSENSAIVEPSTEDAGKTRKRHTI